MEEQKKAEEQVQNVRGLEGPEGLAGVVLDISKDFFFFFWLHCNNISECSK